MLTLYVIISRLENNVIGHATIRLATGNFLLVVLWNGPLESSHYLLTVFEIFNGECDAMADMTLNDL